MKRRTNGLTVGCIELFCCFILRLSSAKGRGLHNLRMRENSSKCMRDFFWAVGSSPHCVKLHSLAQASFHLSIKKAYYLCVKHIVICQDLSKPVSHLGIQQSLWSVCDVFIAWPGTCTNPAPPEVNHTQILQLIPEQL